MKHRAGIQTSRLLGVLVLVAILAALTPLSFHSDSVTSAQTESSTDLEAPTLTATPTGATAVELSWAAVTGAARYELWVWTNDGGWQQLDEGALTATEYRHKGLSAGTTYYYWVRAVSESGETGDWSERMSATVAAPQSSIATSTPTATPTPTAPTQITATPTSTTASTTSLLSQPVLTATAGEGAVALSWAAVTGAARYELRVWTSADDWQQLDEGALTATDFSHTELTAGTTYHYWVRAVNESGETSEWSERVSATVAAPPSAAESTATATPTATPTSTPNATTASTPTSTSTSTSPASTLSTPVLTAEAGEGEVELSWEAVAGAARYELRVWTSADDWQQLDDGALTATNFSHTELSAGTTYYYWVRAVGDSGETSEWSERASATLAAPTSTGEPTATATDNAGATSTQIRRSPRHPLRRPLSSLSRS